MKEAAARIKINRLLENAGWRFFADAKGPANIQLEPSVTLTSKALDDLGENFEKAVKGFIDFLLLNEKGFPFIVLEAKAEDKSPLVGKEQARKYAKSLNRLRNSSSLGFGMLPGHCEDGYRVAFACDHQHLHWADTA